jgi:hypothetical protein
MMRDSSVGYSEAQVARAGARFVASIDPKRYVGHKHHVVPAFILKRFANAKNQLLVRDLARNSDRTVNVNDLAVTDFYTFINTSGDLDSSYEHLWGEIEGGASRALRDHLQTSPFVKPRPFSVEEKVALDALVALQLLRGPTLRRVSELITDYRIKLTNTHLLSADDMVDLEFAPHQNDHLAVMARLLERVATHLATRAAWLVTIDRPGLIICDEPVCLEPADDGRVPVARDSSTRPGSRRNKKDRPHRPADVIEIRGTGVGLANASELALPLGPTVALVYDYAGSAAPRQHMRLSGEEAAYFERSVVRICAQQAVEWIAASPENLTLNSIDVSVSRPLLTINDGGSLMAETVNGKPRCSPHRLNKKAKPESSATTPGDVAERWCEDPTDS